LVMALNSRLLPLGSLKNMVCWGGAWHSTAQQKQQQQQPASSKEAASQQQAICEGALHANPWICTHVVQCSILAWYM
jgi:hypothetical protein